MIVGFEFPKLPRPMFSMPSGISRCSTISRRQSQGYRKEQRKHIEDKLGITMKKAQWAEFCRRAGLREPGQGTKPRNVDRD